MDKELQVCYKTQEVAYPVENLVLVHNLVQTILAVFRILAHQYNLEEVVVGWVLVTVGFVGNTERWWEVANLARNMDFGHPERKTNCNNYLGN